MTTIARVSALKSCSTIADVEKLAKLRLAVNVKDFVCGGAEGQWTLERNVRQFEKFLIRKRIPDKIRTEVCLKTELQIKNTKLEYDLPIGMSPISLHGLVHAKAEEPMITASNTLNVPAIASSLSNLPFDKIATVSKENNAWIQMYIPANEKHMFRSIELIHKLDYKALVVSIGCPISGRRRNDERNQFSLPAHLRYGNFPHVRSSPRKHPAPLLHSEHISQYVSQTFQWENLKDIIQKSDMPVIAKGILRGDDAERAIEAGCHGIFVSNHGGRQLDHVPATIECLREIVKLVNKRVPILMDCGVRSGADILKALGLGADFVFIGRPYLYGLSLSGKAGIIHVFDILKQELVDELTAAGYSDIQSVKDDVINNFVVHESYYNDI